MGNQTKSNEINAIRFQLSHQTKHPDLRPSPDQKPLHEHNGRNSKTLPGWQRIFFLLSVTTVKKYVPPFVPALRYRIILMLMGYCWVSFLNPTYLA
jgi:hypothetical protein